MTPVHHSCRRVELSAHELYALITADARLHHHVLATSRDIAPQIGSLVEAMIILGTNTVKHMALHHQEVST